VKNTSLTVNGKILRQEMIERAGKSDWRFKVNNNYQEINNSAGIFSFLFCLI